MIKNRHLLESRDFKKMTPKQRRLGQMRAAQTRASNRADKLLRNFTKDPPDDNDA